MGTLASFLGATLPAAAAGMALSAGLLAASCGSDRRAVPRGVAPHVARDGGPGDGTSSGGFNGSSGGGGEAGSGPAEVIVDPEAPCDEGLSVDDADPVHAARAVEICKQASGDNDWGLVSAAWVTIDGSPVEGLPAYDLGHGVLDAFGKEVAVRSGARLLALSSGTARQPGEPDYASPGGFDKGYVLDPPPGFPKEAPSCPGVVTGEPHDGVALELVLRAPAGANGLAFDFDFYTFEWPIYICSQYNDVFVALLDPPPAGQPDGNISFDQLGNPVSVNNVFVRICGCAGGPPCDAPPGSPQAKKFDCELGAAELGGTGFEDHAATGWLFTHAPVAGGAAVTLRWAAWDSGDGILDSTTLIDNFRWLGQTEADAGTQPVPR